MDRRNNATARNRFGEHSESGFGFGHSAALCYNRRVLDSNNRRRILGLGWARLRTPAAVGVKPHYDCTAVKVVCGLTPNLLFEVTG